MSLAMSLHIDSIVVPAGRRPIDTEAVKRLAESIGEIGLQHPITVRSYQGAFALIAGGHRLEAMRKLGETHILATVAEFDAIDAELWEISENLDRCEVPQLDRGEYIDRWRTLKASKGAQVAHPSSNAQPHEHGVTKTAEALGISRREVQRAQKIASITPQAKQAARDTGLDNNVSALLEASAESPERQADKLREIADRKAAGRRKISKADAEGSEDHKAKWEEWKRESNSQQSAHRIAEMLQSALRPYDLYNMRLALQHTTIEAILEQINDLAGPNEWRPRQEGEFE